MKPSEWKLLFHRGFLLTNSSIFTTLLAHLFCPAWNPQKICLNLFNFSSHNIQMFCVSFLLNAMNFRFWHLVESSNSVEVVSSVKLTWPIQNIQLHAHDAINTQFDRNGHVLRRRVSLLFFLFLLYLYLYLCIGAQCTQIPSLDSCALRKQIHIRYSTTSC